MCGIAGIIVKNRIQHMFGDELFAMCRCQRHRGPDDEGGVALDMDAHKIREIFAGQDINCKGMMGFERLSIQDLSYKGHQPMQNVDSDISIVFNGEIYNFKELGEKLIKKGHVFESGTDTEIILHMYMEYGIKKTLIELNGMFAFAIADMRIGKLYIARDRFGIKPLYMAEADDAFLFASEMKVFLSYHGFSPRLDMEAVEEYMLFKSLMSNTLLEGVKQMEAGTVLELDLETNETRQEKYFDVESYSRNNNIHSYSDLKENVWETMRSVVRRQVISDAKVGCQLSGGIDSSILCKIASEEHGLLDTVSCKVDCLFQSDDPYIDIVNKSLGLNAHIQNINAKTFIDNLIDVVWHFDSIMSHTPAAGMIRISECANENGIKVLLSGEGADELFGGYKCFSDLAFQNKETEKENIIDAIVFRDGREDTDFLKRILPTIKPERFYQKRIDYLNCFTGSVFDKQVKYEMTTQLGELLCRQDKMSMAHSVENRVPYLDNEMVQLAWNIPERYLMNSEAKEGKFILKDVASDFFGREFAFRDKVGFFIPGNMFLSSNTGFIHKVLGNAKKRGVICCDMLEQWADHELGVIGGLNHFRSALFSKMFTLEIWCELFLDGRSVDDCKEMLN